MKKDTYFQALQERMTRVQRIAQEFGRTRTDALAHLFIIDCTMMLVETCAMLVETQNTPDALRLAHQMTSAETGNMFAMHNEHAHLTPAQKERHDSLRTQYQALFDACAQETTEQTAWPFIAFTATHGEEMLSFSVREGMAARLVDIIAQVPHFMPELAEALRTNPSN